MIPYTICCSILGTVAFEGAGFAIYLMVSIVLGSIVALYLLCCLILYWYHFKFKPLWKKWKKWRNARAAKIQQGTGIAATQSSPSPNVIPCHPSSMPSGNQVQSASSVETVAHSSDIPKYKDDPNAAILHFKPTKGITKPRQQLETLPKVIYLDLDDLRQNREDSDRDASK